MLTIVRTSGKDVFYLNHAYLTSLSFGSLDMAWTTARHSEAAAMLARCRAKHKGKRWRLKITELD